jgi:ubiquinone/menaquinone biosynthesis C-methylase UbiE
VAVPFDHIAFTYDSIFSKTAIGQLQRKCVWKYVEKVMQELNGFEMLELHFGTGDDADMFGEHGFNIVATDIGSEMLKLTSKKSAQFSMQNAISSHYLDLENFDQTFFDKKFDLVFSNFGGMNCIDPASLKSLLQKLPMILNPGGRFIGIVMPRFCAWETVYFLLRFQMRKAFRRLTSKQVLTTVDGIDLKTWYYNPRQIRKWSAANFSVVAMNPVGVVLPSSYVETFEKFGQRLLLRLNRVEKKLSNASLFAGMADHFIVDLKLI